MPRKLVWTAAQDTQIRRLRAEGASWDTIAAILGFTRWTVIERGRRIGARRRRANSSRRRKIHPAIPSRQDIQGAGA